MAQDQILLTPHQRSVVTKGVAYLKEDNHRILLIQGSAGTGKTTLVHTLVSELSHELSAKKDRTYSVVMTAPTHKAVEVLRQKNSDEDNIYTEFCTLHSALRLKYSIDEDKGIEEYIPDPSIRERKLSGATILVIDEASMIGTDLLHYIDLSLEDNKLLKVIFIGDNKQLPPVNEPSYISPIFNQGYKQLGLTEIIRQAAENPIIPSPTTSTSSIAIPITRHKRVLVIVSPKTLRRLLGTLCRIGTTPTSAFSPTPISE